MLASVWRSALGAVVVSAILAASCTDSGGGGGNPGRGGTTGNAGRGGTTGTAGRGGTIGSAGAGGTTGTAGNGGTTGTAGSGGATGTGGAAGSAGTGGAGGAGGAAGTAGAAGIGGAAGAGGAGGAAGTGGAAGNGGAAGAAGTGGGIALNCNQSGQWRGDFDGDGVQDCARAQAGTGTRLDLLFNKGVGAGLYLAAGVLTPDTVPPDYRTFYGTSVFDLNHDGRQDIIVGFPDPLGPDDYGRIQLFRGQADGTFVRYASSDSFDGLLVVGSFKEGTGDLTFADFDGDGFPDVLVVPYRHFSLTTYDYFWDVLMSSGGLDLHMKSSSGVQQLRGVPVVKGVADLNKDGKADLAVLAQANPASITSGMLSYVAVSFGAGDGSFTGTPTKITGTDGATDLSVSDVNTDTKPDLVVTLPGGPTTFYGNGAGQFSTTPPASF